ncbi:MAG: site-specific integrase, partial [Candidatus Caldarchaeum sp.]
VKKLVLNARPGKKHLFWFYAVTGARLREALDVRVEDVDLENKPPRVYLKGTKSPSAKRIVFLPPDIAKELKSLVEGKPGNYPLFSREDDARKAPHPHRVDMSFRSLLRQTGLLQKDPSGKGYVYSLHSFRRFYETTLLNSGVSPMAAALLLGHHIGVEASYYKPTVESLAAEWSKAEKALTLFPEPRDEKEARERDERIKQLEDRLSQIEHLLSTIAELELAPGEDLGPLTSYYRAAGISRDMGLIRYVRKATAQPVEEASPKSSARL